MHRPFWTLRVFWLAHVVKFVFQSVVSLRPLAGGLLTFFVFREFLNPVCENDNGSPLANTSTRFGSGCHSRFFYCQKAAGLIWIKQFERWSQDESKEEPTLPRTQLQKCVRQTTANAEGGAEAGKIFCPDIPLCGAAGKAEPPARCMICWLRQCRMRPLSW